MKNIIANNKLSSFNNPFNQMSKRLFNKHKYILFVVNKIL
jgi:hypothetical protein